MNARIVLAVPVLALAFAASPAFAREGATSRMAEKLNDPATQRAMGAAIAAVSEAMLDMPLEPLARAAEAMGDRRTARRMRGARLRDVAPEAEDMPRELAHKLPAMMGAMGGMAASVEEMTPALKAMAKEMGARMGEAMRGAGDVARQSDGADDRDYRDEVPPSAQDEGEAPYPSDGVADIPGAPQE